MYECERGRQTWIKKNKERSGGKPKKEKEKEKWKQKESANVLSIPNFFTIGLLSFVSSSSAFLFLKLSATMTMATLFPRASCTSKRNAPVAYLTIKELHGAITLASLMALNKELVHIYIYNHIFFPPLFFSHHITTLAMFLYRWTWSEGTMTQVTMLSLVFRWRSL